MAFEIGADILFEEFATSAAIDAAAVEGASSMVAAYETATVAASAGAGALGATALNLGANFLVGQLIGALGRGNRASKQTAQGALINAVSNVDPISVIYGSRRVGGTRVLTEVTGNENQYLNMVIVLGEGQVQAINTIYLDGVAITDPRFSGLATAWTFVGSDSQVASGELIASIGNPAKWNANCTLSGIAYIFLFLVWSRNAFPSGMPIVTADVDGRTLYDPRTGLTAFSHNPALAIRDYLTSARYGRGIPTSMIDDASFIVAANHCDESVTVPSGSQVRYTCDGVVNVDQQPIDNLRTLLSACRGYLVFSGGLYKLKCEKTDTPVSFTLNEDNIIGGWSFTLPSKRTKFNRVKARFFNAAANWQEDVGLQESLTFRTQDNGLVLDTVVDVPYTSDSYRAKQIAQLVMKRSRFGIQVSLTATIAAMQLEVGDVVPVTHTTPGWVSKLFRVAEIELLYSDEVRLTLLEYDATAYTLDTLATVNTAPATNLPDATRVAAPGAPTVVESLYATSGSAGVKSRATVTWLAAADRFVQDGGWYQLERSPTGAGSWTLYPRIQTPGSGTVTFLVDDVAPGTYDWRVAAFNSMGVMSAYSPITIKEIVGLNAPPSNISNFTVQSYSGMAKFTWSKLSSNGLDLAVLQQGRVFIRWSPKTGGASWDFGSLVNPDGYPGDGSHPAIGPLMTGTYMAKAWNGKTFSTTEAIFVATEALITGLSTIATVTESPTFAGAKTNVAAVDSGIQIDGTTLIDSMLTNIDTWPAIDSLGGVRASGSYSFGSKLDLGSKTPCRLFSTIDSVAFSTDDMIDSRTDPIDTWGLVDGVVIEDAEIQLWVRHTDDDPNAAPSWSSFEPLGLVADYNFRGFDFRLDFATAQATHNRTVTTLSVAAKH